MYEADELCDRIAFINKGEIVMIDTPANIKSKLGSGATVQCTFITKEDSEAIAQQLKEQGFRQIELNPEGEVVKCKAQVEEPQAFISALYELKHLQVVDLSIVQTSLEDAYIQLIGGEGA